MKQPELPVVLASASPRRKELMENLGLDFLVDASEADETFEGTPQQMVSALAERKAAAVAARHPDSIVLAADTIVWLHGEALGKPKNKKDAERMLILLSGRWHTVLTGVSVVNTKTGRQETAVEETRVHFVRLTGDDVRDYLASGEPMDKAGAYAIQGLGGAFVDRIEGSYSNVVGLPMHAAARLIARAAKD